MAEIDVEQLVLSAVSTHGFIEDTWNFSIQHNLDHQVIQALNSLLIMLINSSLVKL